MQATERIPQIMLPVLLLLALALGGHARTVVAAAHRPHEDRRRSDGAAECAAIGPQAWVHQLGTNRYDEVRAVAVNPTSGDIVVVGHTSGTLPGSLEPNAGASDGFIAVYTADGTRRWVHQLGSSSVDEVYAVAVQPSSGDIVVAGETYGTLPGSPEANAGSYDGFVAVYSADGARRWVHQLGSSQSDHVRAVAVNPTSGDIVVAGDTGGTLPGSLVPAAKHGIEDGFVAVYTSSGARRWVHQLGSTNRDYMYAVAVNPGSGDIVVAGETGDTLPGSPEVGLGRNDGFVAVYTADGTRRWVRQLGTSSDDEVYAVAVQPGSGDIVVAGFTGGTLPGSPDANAGDLDGFVAAYTADGTRRWVRQLGTSSIDRVDAVAVQPGSGDIVVVGFTDGALADGEQDTDHSTAPAPPPSQGCGIFRCESMIDSDGFVAVYTADGGTRRQVHQLGSGARDIVYAVAVQPSSGDVVVAGFTGGTLPGSPEANAGGNDGFVAVYQGCATATPPTVAPVTAPVLPSTTATSTATLNSAAPTISAAAHLCFELVGDGNCRDVNGDNTDRDSQERRPGSSLAVCIQSCIAMVGCTGVEYRRLETGEECELHTQEVATFDADSNRQCYRRLAPAVNGCPAESTQAPTTGSITTTIVRDANAGDKSLAVAGVTGINVGDALAIGAASSNNHETGTVTAVSSGVGGDRRRSRRDVGTVTLADALQNSYNEGTTVTFTARAEEDSLFDDDGVIVVNTNPPTPGRPGQGNADADADTNTANANTANNSTANNSSSTNIPSTGTDSGGSSGGAVAGAVVGVLLAIAAGVGVALFIRKRREGHGAETGAGRWARSHPRPPGGGELGNTANESPAVPNAAFNLETATDVTEANV